MGAAHVDLNDIPDHDTHHTLTLFMEDTAWPHEGMLDDYLDGRTWPVRARASPKRGTDGSRCWSCAAVLQTAWGSGRPQ